MSNLHGFNDNNNRNNVEGAGMYRIIGDPNDPNNMENGIYYQSVYKGNPRQQSFCSVLKDTVCPLFEFKSFTFAMIVINTLMFIIVLCVGGLDTIDKKSEFLPPNQNTLDDFGSLNIILLKSSILKNIYRWVANSFLHKNFLHLFFNMVSLLILGPPLEVMIGSLKFGILYIIGGITGSLFSVLVAPKIISSVGASISIFSVIGVHFGVISHKYNSMIHLYGHSGRNIWILTVSIFTILGLFGLFSFSSNENINVFGHLGGLICAYILCVPFLKIDEGDNSILFSYRIWWWISIILSIVYPCVGFPCFYLL